MAIAFISKTSLPKALKFATGGNLVLPLRYVQLRWNPLRQRIREVTFVLQRRQRNDTTFFLFYDCINGRCKLQTPISETQQRSHCSIRTVHNFKLQKKAEYKHTPRQPTATPEIEKKWQAVSCGQNICFKISAYIVRKITSETVQHKLAMVRIASFRKNLTSPPH